MARFLPRQFYIRSAAIKSSKCFWMCGFSDLSDVLCYAALRVANQPGNDIGVELAHQISTGLGAKSEIGGKSSSMVLRVASTASSDLGGSSSVMLLDGIAAIKSASPVGRGRS